MSHLHTSNHMMWGDIHVFVGQTSTSQNCYVNIPRLSLCSADDHQGEKKCLHSPNLQAWSCRNMTPSRLKYLDCWTAKDIMQGPNNLGLRCLILPIPCLQTVSCLETTCLRGPLPKMDQWTAQSSQVAKPQRSAIPRSPCVFVLPLVECILGFTTLAPFKKQTGDPFSSTKKTFPPLAIKHGNGKYRFIDDFHMKTSI